MESTVVAELNPAIQSFCKMMDARIKSAHDALELGGTHDRSCGRDET
jgi:hypothetical protein